MKRTNRQGEVWTNNDGETLHIIEYNGVNDCTIRFGDGTVLKNIQYHNIISGGVKNNNRKSVFDIGYIGYGAYKASVNGKHTKLRKGDVIVLPIGTKTRPCVIIKVLKEVVVALPLTSSENSHNITPYNSRFFGEGHFSNDMVTCNLDVAKDKFVGILDDKESLNIAISNFKKFVEKL